MVRKLVTAGALACAVMPVFSVTASAKVVLPWVNVERSANVICLDYTKKLFKLPGIVALQKVKTKKDLTPAVMKNAMVPYLTGELALEKTMVRRGARFPRPGNPPTVSPGRAG